MILAILPSFDPYISNLCASVSKILCFVLRIVRAYKFVNVFSIFQVLFFSLVVSKLEYATLSLYNFNCSLTHEYSFVSYRIFLYAFNVNFLIIFIGSRL